MCRETYEIANGNEVDIILGDIVLLSRKILCLSTRTEPQVKASVAAQDPLNPPRLLDAAQRKLTSCVVTNAVTMFGTDDLRSPPSRREWLNLTQIGNPLGNPPVNEIERGSFHSEGVTFKWKATIERCIKNISLMT
ncbi:hypothetical protein EVAR_46403_1 [Eumeta japonica]|uniref:Uncharacterized protein n=1 Tax=Eumeta variegata TaxID=151549 RepID=A0A4C1WU97_EUMVA|nr:hypothetical protein EVAR_46403_1 [Eumeta japonica]